MATVFLAHDLKHDREVAIKLVLPEVAAALGSERFLREIRIAAHLQHPHILKLIDSGEVRSKDCNGAPSVLADPPTPGATTPWCEGDDLRSRRGRLRRLLSRLQAPGWR